MTDSSAINHRTAVEAEICKWEELCWDVQWFSATTSRFTEKDLHKPLEHHRKAVLQGKPHIDL